MAWVRIDDALPEHEKVCGISNAAFRLHISAMCWSNRRLTDGVIPEGIISMLLPGEFLNCERAASGNPPGVCAEHFAQELVLAGLWHPHDEGWEIHDFLLYQLPKAKVLKERAKSAERIANARIARNVREVFAKCSPDVRPNIDECSSEVRIAPTPTPIPTQKREKDPPSSPNGEPRSVSKPRIPLPFTVPTALEAIAKTANGRFVVSEPTKGAAIRLNSAIRKFPDLADWSLFGEYLAAGGRSWQSEPFGPSACASAKWPELVAEARAWRDDGKPPLTKPHRAYSSPPPSRHMQPVSDFSSVRPGQHDLRDYLPDAPARRTT